MMGERGTLLLPSLRPLPSVDISMVAKAYPLLEVLPVERDARDEIFAKARRAVEMPRRVLALRVVEVERFEEEAA